MLCLQQNVWEAIIDVLLSLEPALEGTSWFCGLWKSSCVMHKHIVHIVEARDFAIGLYRKERRTRQKTHSKLTCDSYDLMNMAESHANLCMR